MTQRAAYNQLTQAHRYQIVALKQAGHNVDSIAETLGFDRSSIYRELERNKNDAGGYTAKAAQKKRDARVYKAHAIPKKIEEYVEIILEKLREYWSPEQISGYLKSTYKGKISAKSIYNFIHQQILQGADLKRYLRRKCKKYRKRNTQETRGKLNNRRSIDERPKEVEDKKTFGHWEADTIIGKDHKSAILVVTERKTKFTLMQQLEKNSAQNTQQAFAKMFKNNLQAVKTITTDNGKEFANHKSIEKDLDCKVYFTKPYSSWQKGLVENTNGLIRQFIPKKSDFRNISNQEITNVQNLLNFRPRKMIQFNKPADVISLFATF